MVLEIVDGKIISSEVITKEYSKAEIESELKGIVQMISDYEATVIRLKAKKVEYETIILQV